MNEKVEQSQLRKRQSELEPKHDRLLDAFLSGTIDKETYEKKAFEIKGELERFNVILPPKR